MTAPTLDWSRYRLTRLRVAAICGVLLAIAVGVTAQQFSASKNLVLASGAVVGGDFVAFYSASRAALEGDAARAYDAAEFSALLKEHSPAKDEVKLTWQYPPTYFLALLPLGRLDYLAAYCLFLGASMAAFFAFLGSRFSPFFLFAILASPSVFAAAITGQNGFLTATLLALAALCPDRRPIVAGLAAALLTMKPQLGVLLPFAYVAGGCWRAFLVATAGAIALVAASVGVFGVEIWSAFIGGLGEASDNLATGLMPLFKMATPYAAARFAGLPLEVSALVHALFALFAALLVVFVWRNVKDPELRAATLVSGVFFAAPYGFYYELVILAVPAAILARRALAGGWLRHEQAALALVFILPMELPGTAARHGVSLGFVVVLLLAASVLRRVAHEAPEALATPAAAFSWLRRAFPRRDSRALRRPERPATGA